MDSPVVLPASVTRDALEIAGRPIRGGLHRLLERSGFRIVSTGARSEIRKQHGVQPTLLQSVRLTNEAGNFTRRGRQLVNEKVHPDTGTSSVEYADQLGSSLIASPWNARQLELWKTEDPAAWFEKTICSADISLYRVTTTPSLWERQIVLRVLDALAAGEPPERTGELLGSRRSDRRMLQANSDFDPAFLVGFPLVSRQQPMAVFLRTGHGALIAAVPTKGAFGRFESWTSWPAALPLPGLLGRNEDAYRFRDSQIPDGAGDELLRAAAVGANRLLLAMTDPLKWRTQGGEYDSEVRQLVWATVLFGIDTVNDIGRHFEDSLWSAFRALDMLSGLWEGGRDRARVLPQLLLTSRIQRFAAQPFPEGFHRRWAEDVAASLEAELDLAFPGEQEADRLSKVVDLRNLLHGVIATGPDRSRRIEVLRALGRKDGPALAPLRDLATLWWGGVLLTDEPLRYLTPGSPPWSTSH